MQDLHYQLLNYLFIFIFSSNEHKNKDFKFIISKGHAVPAWYATLIELGILKKKILIILES